MPANVLRKVPGGVACFARTKKTKTPEKSKGVGANSQRSKPWQAQIGRKDLAIPILKPEPPRVSEVKEKQEAVMSMMYRFGVESPSDKPKQPRTIASKMNQFGLGPKGRGAELVRKAQQQPEKLTNGGGIKNGSSEVRHPQRPAGLREEEHSPVRGQNESENGLASEKGWTPVERDSRENWSPHLSGQKRTHSSEYESVFKNSSRQNQQSTTKFHLPPAKKTHGPRYGSMSKRTIVTPKRDTRQNRLSFITLPKSQQKKAEAMVDLTGDSDDEGGASQAPSRADLIDVTGSSSTGVDSSDVCPAQDTIDLEIDDGDSDGEECDFLKEWVGSDEFIKQICRGKQEQEEEEESAERPGLSTVKALGMGSFSLDQQVMNCLADSTWLNDEVINAYMALLSIRSAVRSTPAETSEDEADPEVDEERGSRARGETETGLTCEYFSSFFYALLRNAKGGYSHENVKRWARKKNLSRCDRIFFPINVSNSHWCLAVVYPKKKLIRYFDSLGGQNSNCLKLLERYMQDEGSERGDESLQGAWTRENVGPPQVPRQQDGSSCGVFLCAFADCLSVGQEPAGFTQHHIKSMRKAMRQFLGQCRM
mmetsp:Transcript_25279/g.60006  ORF Transcript_25279/g.60006 Transcript_25279/m.60006 type:complete len:594 (+) Transcript_25279:219-2000(+)